MYRCYSAALTHTHTHSTKSVQLSDEICTKDGVTHAVAGPFLGEECRDEFCTRGEAMQGELGRAALFAEIVTLWSALQDLSS